MWKSVGSEQKEGEDGRRTHVCLLFQSWLKVFGRWVGEDGWSVSSWEFEVFSGY